MREMSVVIHLMTQGEYRYDSLGFHYRLALESAVHTSPLKRLNISPDFPMHLKEPHAAPLIGGFGGASVPSSQEVL